MGPREREGSRSSGNKLVAELRVGRAASDRLGEEVSSKDLLGFDDSQLF